MEPWNGTKEIENLSMQITPRSIQVSVVKDISAHVPDYKNKQNYNDCYKNAKT